MIKINSVKQVKNLLVERRLELGFNQNDLSKLTKIRQGTLSKVENKKSGMTISMLLKILKSLNLELFFQERIKK